MKTIKLSPQQKDELYILYLYPFIIAAGILIPQITPLAFGTILFITLILALNLKRAQKP